MKNKDKLCKVKLRILPFPPWYNLKPSFQFYPTKSANHSRGVSLLITETITHIIKTIAGLLRKKSLNYCGFLACFADQKIYL